ncbi:hypothetical protein CMV_000302 [Castanea mollissima]|uniref:Uncharacterized protein n=1 Tax=Castanea mollissima TaxID=60419 RepID=A0A8J4VXT5_9ROSI|nr:hypothetical protein CMV_000302 [Castanea mollissima]
MNALHIRTTALRDPIDEYIEVVLALEVNVGLGCNNEDAKGLHYNKIYGIWLITHLNRSGKISARSMKSPPDLARSRLLRSDPQFIPDRPGNKQLFKDEGVYLLTLIKKWEMVSNIFNAENGEVNYESLTKHIAQIGKMSNFKLLADHERRPCST